MDTAFLTKLEERSVPVPESGCWLWLGASTKGYGVVRFGRTQHYAHRISYILAKGAIPEGLVVAHKCDTPLCINPSHLFAATQKENLHDAAAKGRMKQPAAEQHWNRKITWELVDYMRNSDKTNTELAKELSLKQNTVSQIRSGKRWKRDANFWSPPE